MQLELNDNGEIHTRVENLTKKAIETIKTFEPMALTLNNEGYYVAFSGGKDSIVLEDLFKKARVKYTLNHNITGLDHPEVIYFMRKYYPELNWHMYKNSMFKLIVQKGMPPTRLIRYCCAELKERGGNGYFIATGVRHAESPRRKNTRGLFEAQGSNIKNNLILLNDNDENRQTFENCQLKGKRILNPILYWTDEDVWSYIKINNLPYPKLYDLGYKRLGCIGCPLATKKQRIKELEDNPKFKENYIRAFDKMVQKRIQDGKPTQWKNGQEVYDWWIEG